MFSEIADRIRHKYERAFRVHVPKLTDPSAVSWKVATCVYCMIQHQSFIYHLERCEPYLEFAEIADALEQQ